MEHTGNIDVLDVVSVLCTLLQNQRNIQGRLRVGSKERLTFSGQLQLNPTHSTHQAIKVKGNFFHQLQVSGLRSILRKVFRLKSRIYVHDALDGDRSQQCSK